MKKSAIPNTFTLGNLAFGLLSILMTFHGNFKLAAIFVLLAALADRYDGRIARLLNVDSEIGKELDSLADLVSFGVAPSILIYRLYNFMSFGFVGYLLVLVFPICGAYRLARYNISTFDGVFTGVPITLAGSFMAVFALFTVNRPLNPALPVIFIVSLSYLMISKFQLKKV
ncbi:MULTISPECIES: CDP-diacylglycerol--serine O-phosphatidyltransferase [Clostridium]|uniref:CDP-diacylglycerol--serine O-phosphatidyltransferase n=1 Tax=Clostridium cadaveris TaxID=1529 RepID=A0A1I2KEP9_9CLOT|nr:CDP-diacylglycerol--serine O-phosphatidyltransferase [Clostridium cadaveris]MDU4952108.1 CDP-diacylglycerol--serine O-phosphatidyltransferase [Clostridium sp.]MDM8310575.1 CDP-diacylglycerol--serine O-phosphatidyltransferase [Clostridium cadaveris]MDY4948637.1 CDP-diacylglycerol--serine O-phosphatidyltransferase [Clostridium cadaveris]NME65126.1 CDP-diacylglycerol--serine O-phosphatidyltransferase [Clostridium cadaveris]NWK11416.1 CDP-diacylglycerol--serine O-phosphatidyltransferase [Clostr